MDKRRFYLGFVFLVFVVFFQHSSAILEFDDDDDDAPPSRCPWIRNKLKNGRVKIRSRGRVAKFQCDPGYDLAGKRYATCVRGQWNNAIPICVARGCPRRPNVLNSRVSEMFRGALLTYECLPGYSLSSGTGTIYCDGRRWSPGAPDCVAYTTDSKTSCDFEPTDLCGWSNDPTHDFDWRRNQYATPSGHVGTGPTFDHTFGAGRGGIYLYMEASAPRKEHDTARLFSPVYSEEYSGGCFVFWYHMFGVSTGGLRVYIKPESHVFGELTPAWELFGEQGNQWLQGNVTVPLLRENFQVIIEGTRGNGYIGDTAIDDVFLSQEYCEHATNDNGTESDIDTSSCRGRCKETRQTDSCSCEDFCVSDGNCCSDYQTYCAPSSPETEETESPDEQPRQSSTTSTTEGNKEDISPVPSSGLQSSTSSDYASNSLSSITDAAIITAPITSSSTSSVSITSSSTTTIVPSTTTPSTTTPAPTTTAPRPATTTPKPTTTTPKPTTTTPNPTTTTPKPTTTTPKPTTTTPKPTTTTPKPTTTTPKPTATTLKPTTAPPTSTTLVPSTKRTTSMPSTTPDFCRNCTESPVYINTLPPQRITLPPGPTSTAKSLTSTFPSTSRAPETRRTYNLRPRNRITTTAMTPPQTRRYTTPSPRTSPTWIRSSPTTKRYFTTTMTVPITTRLPETTTSTQRSKFKLTTEGASAHKEAHPSKAASDEPQSAVTTVSVTVVSMVAIVAAVVFGLRRWRAHKKSKMADDSEMRFLAENEVIEFSDATALDRHSMDQPLI